MNEKTTIDIIVAVIALFGVIGAAIASIYAVLITTAKNEEIERLKLSNTLQIEYDMDLRTRRIESQVGCAPCTLNPKRDGALPRCNVWTWRHIGNRAGIQTFWAGWITRPD